MGWIITDEPVRFAEYNPTISLSSTPSPIPNVPQLTEQLNNPNHPGEGWSEYDHGNTHQYPLVFLNEYGQDEVACYVTFMLWMKSTPSRNPIQTPTSPMRTAPKSSYSQAAIRRPPEPTTKPGQQPAIKENL